MPMFEDRERSFEAKFAHDEEFRFLVAARRDKLFAHAVARQLGLREQGAAELAAAALALPDGPGHDAALIRHMAKILTEHGRGTGAADLAALLENCGVQARLQLLSMPTPEPLVR